MPAVRAPQSSRSDALLVGVDGGASEVRACAVLEGGDGTLVAGPQRGRAAWAPPAGFEPVDLELQLEQQGRGTLDLAPGERQAGAAWITGAAGVIAAVARAAGQARVRVGMCMPGLKDAGGRGIEVLRHGPRMPRFLDELERELERRELELAEPIPPLLSDGVACALGEQRAAGGALRGVRTAYFVGGGTGLAEALVLGGRVIGLDELEGTLAKAWQMHAGFLSTYEDRIALGGLNRDWARQCGYALPLAEGQFPEQALLAGDARARELLLSAGTALGRLAYDRLTRLHAHHGALLERMVVGQRLGLLLEDPALRELVLGAAAAELGSALRAEGPVELLAHLRAGACALSVSALREAPVLGAAARTLEEG